MHHRLSQSRQFAVTERRQSSFEHSVHARPATTTKLKLIHGSRVCPACRPLNVPFSFIGQNAKRSFTAPHAKRFTSHKNNFWKISTNFFVDEIIVAGIWYSMFCWLVYKAITFELDDMQNMIRWVLIFSGEISDALKCLKFSNKFMMVKQITRSPSPLSLSPSHTDRDHNHYKWMHFSVIAVIIITRFSFCFSVFSVSVPVPVLRRLSRSIKFTLIK